MVTGGYFISCVFPSPPAVGAVLISALFSSSECLSLFVFFCQPVPDIVLRLSNTLNSLKHSLCPYFIISSV